MESVGPILITGGGAPGAPGILKAVKQAYQNERIYSCDVQQETIGRLLADDYFTVLSGSEKDYSSTLLAKCLERGIKKILPITTNEVAALARDKKIFSEKNIDVIVSPIASLKVANNKGSLYEKLKANSIDVPDFKVVSNIAEAKEAIRYFTEMNEPFITKPCVGNGSRGFRILNSGYSHHDLLFKHKPSSVFTSEGALLDALCEKPFSPILLSEYLPGQEYTVDCLVHHGTPLLIIPRSRDKMNNGISVAGQIVNDAEIIDYCEQILSVFQFHGPIGIQVKRNKNGKPLLVEINPRIQGTTVACIGAGVDIAALAFSPSPQISILNDYPIKWGTKFIRHYVEEYYS